MATAKLSNAIHEVTLFVADIPTEDGRIYTAELCHWVAERLTKKPPIIIQEISAVERKLKDIPVAEPWSARVMADVIGGEMEDNALKIYFRCRNNKYGRKLETVIRQIGLTGIEFTPVGYGESDNTGAIKPGYQLNYISVEIIDRTQVT
jgi:hypothetical protein